jgi:hypothetical protein
MLLSASCQDTDTKFYEQLVLTGQIIDSHSNLPIANANVLLMKYVSKGALSGKYEPVQTFYTDTAGRYVINFKPEGRARYRLYITKDLLLDTSSADRFGRSKLYPGWTELLFDSYSKTRYEMNGTLTPTGVVKFVTQISLTDYTCFVKAGSLQITPMTTQLGTGYAVTPVAQYMPYEILLVSGADTLMNVSDSLYCEPYRLNIKEINY